MKKIYNGRTKKAMGKLNLIMPMGGGGTRFGNQGFSVPKPLIEIYGKPFFYWATQSITKYIELQILTFVVLNEHVEKFYIDEVIKKYYSDADIVVIPEVLPGAVLTCKAGVQKVTDNDPILFNDCDHLFLSKEFYEFCQNDKFGELDAGLLTFKSNDARFSYVAYGDDGYINRTVEKEVISSDAICGAYYFSNKQIFEKATEIYLENCSYKEFFVSGVYNVLAQQGKKIKNFNTDCHVSFGTPEEYREAITDDSYKKLL